MKPNRADLAFWNAVKTPKWAAKIEIGGGVLKPRKWEGPNIPAALHAAINTHGPYRRRDEAEVEKSNAIACIKMARRRGVDPYCDMVDSAEFCRTVQPKRTETYRRWLRQLERSRVRKVLTNN